MKKASEASLYKPVKEWFLKHRGCEDAVADLPDETRKVRLNANLRIGEIDVVAIESVRKGRRLVHIAEGKRFCKRESFSNCLAQADAVRRYADFLWVFFPKADWLAVPSNDRQANEEAVRKHGFGLLLVSGKNCEVAIDAPKNQDVVDSYAANVFAALEVSAVNTVPFVPPLGVMTADYAASLSALTRGLETLISGALDSTVAWDDDWGFDAVEHQFYVSTLELERCYVVVDPFARYLKDGIPAVWILRTISRTVFDRLMTSGKLRGSHVMFDNDLWDWEVIAAGDLTAEQARRLLVDGFGQQEGTLNLMRYVPVLGRPQNAVQRDVIDAVKELNGQSI